MITTRCYLCGLSFLLAVGILSGQLGAAEDKPFAIQVVDEQTGRGVPLVEFRTVSNVCFYSDSAGWVAIADPTLLNRRVFFTVSSNGYEFPADGFGQHGVAMELKPGGQADIKIKRLNVAERLYRITGEGIYRDSVLLGRPTPIRQPISNAQVAGQDSCQAAVYHGKIHWFWGDTMRLSYPLGQYGTSGAVSELPQGGGLDPAVGIDLSYYVDDHGFSRPMFSQDGNHPQWLDGLIVVKDDHGADRLIGRVSRMKGVSECVSRSLVVFDEDAKKFQTLADIPLTAPLALCGHPFVVKEGETSYIYCGECFPNIRVRADWKSIQDLTQYEAFTCMKTGSRYDRLTPNLDRVDHGPLIWEWKRDTAALDAKRLWELVARGWIKAEETAFRPHDVETRKAILLASGSVRYNEFRKKWILIGCQLHGSSSELGEIWYSEADHPEGPWLWAHKIVTHNHYSFYNPVQHAFFDQQGGRIIYFEGTYSNTFSGNEHPTPLYDYNQIMYRLDLADPRLKMPDEH